MVIYLLKSSACLAVFLMFYFLLLEKERMHTFKRFYLLAALVIAFLIPLVTFTEYAEVPAIPEMSSVNPIETNNLDTTAPVTGKTVPFEKGTIQNYWSIIIWSVYCLGVVLFFLKFLRTILRIARRVRNNPKKRTASLVYVLLRDAIVPHTFWNYLFINHQKFEARKIPEEVLVHEAVHARQKHSLDVLFIEILQILFWFNPLIYFAKKAIKLNHEFLADEAVLNQGAGTSEYQNILLAFASSASPERSQPSMANAINYSSYSSIKKRFNVMKTRTSRKSILLRTVLIAPLIALLLYGFAKRETVFEEDKFRVSANHVRIDEFVNQDKATPAQLKSYNHLAKKYNAQPKEKRVIPIGDLKKLESIFGKMSQRQRAEAQPFPECPEPKSSGQEGATKKQVREYNKLAKKYNDMLAAKGNIRIKKSDVDRLEYLHGLMTEEQRANAESFPDFPEPPEPPQPPAQLSKKEIEAHRDRMKEQSKQLEERATSIQQQAENMRQQDASIREQAEQMKQQAEEVKMQHLEIEKHRKEIEKRVEEIRLEEKAIQEIIANQEIYDVAGKNLSLEQIQATEEHIQAVKRSLSFMPSGHPSIYLDNKEITYAKMKQMEENDEITSVNISKTADGNQIIELNGTSVRSTEPMAPPAPTAPPKPKSPLELLKELKSENVKIILNGKEIGYKEAEKKFEDSTFTRIDVSKGEEERPILKVWTN